MSKPSTSQGQSPAPASEPPATRLPQHPQQRRDEPGQGSAGRKQPRQPGEPRAEDAVLPAPTDAD